MNGSKPITIVGGGLAGLTLGLGLRTEGVPVTIWEANHYPRHRVCGEFISGRGQLTLRRLGVWDTFVEAGAREARTATFFWGRRASAVRSLAPPGLCLSRFAMDAVLAERFRRAGGELREYSRWQGSAVEPGVVRASGRQLQPAGAGPRWFGLKVHAQNVSLDASLEMHVLRDAYVGLCRLAGDTVNVCGLFRQRTGTSSKARPWREVISGPPGTALHERLAGAVFDENSFCSVAGLSLRPQRARSRAECCVGDALTMIPPVAGNGISMAFEAAELAARPLAAYSRGSLPWEEASRAVANMCDAAFARRLAWARWLQSLMLAPLLRASCGALWLRSEWLWRQMFERTRA